MHRHTHIATRDSVFQPRSKQPWLRVAPESKTIDFFETEIIESDFLGHPYQFDFDLINDEWNGDTVLETASESVVEETTAEATTLLVNEEAVETENIDIEDISSDLAWSMLSNTFFLVGGLTDLIISMWDVVTPPPVFEFSNMIHVMIQCTAPVVYLFNSVIDVNWAEHTKQKALQHQHDHQHHHDHHDAIEHHDALPNMTQYAIELHDMPHTHTRRRIKTFSPKRQLVKVLRTSAHRHEYYAALTFGIAAFFAVIDLVMGFSDIYDYTILPGSDRGIFDSWSVHIYLLSAIFAITSSRDRPWTLSWSIDNPDNLEDIGDMIFLVGSFLDVLLCELHFDDNVPQWTVFSCLLWFLDACFYLRSDLVTKAAYNTMSLSGQWVLTPRRETFVVRSEEERQHYNGESERVPAHRSYL